MAYGAIDSPFGRLWLTASEKGLKGVCWSRLDVPAAGEAKNSKKERALLKKAAAQLQQYFSGRRKKFELPLDMEGTSFQKAVWRALINIGHGRTLSYKDVAARIGRPRAVRAVGSANGKNPLCVIVPCHRVIASDGSIGGYSGGLRIKRDLLRLEGLQPEI